MKMSKRMMAWLLCCALVMTLGGAVMAEEAAVQTIVERTQTQTVAPTTEATTEPTVAPAAEPAAASAEATTEPTAAPTAESAAASAEATTEPTAAASAEASAEATAEPAVEPTAEPTPEPTPVSSAEPSPEPTEVPLETIEPVEIPEDAAKMMTLQDALDPSRYIDVWAVFEGDTLYLGKPVTLMAQLHGYENLTYTLHWEVNFGNGWEPIGERNKLSYSFEVNEALYNASWRVVVDITAAEIPDAAE